MRKLYVGLFVSLDGVVEAPNEFVFPYFDEHVGAEVGAGMATTDTVLLGRVLYEQWSAYWPGKTTADDPYAGFINPVRKIVLSTTLTEATWANTELVHGDLTGLVARLKAEEGGTIAVNGSITLARSLIDAGLVDELRLLVFPVIVGKGRRLLDGLAHTPLRLVESKQLPTGVLSLTYAPAAAATES